MENQVTITDVIERLKSGDTLEKKHFFALSDLGQKDFKPLKQYLLSSPVEVTLRLLWALRDQFHDNTRVDYSAIGLWGLDHDDEEVRFWSTILLAHIEKSTVQRRVFQFLREESSPSVLLGALEVLRPCVIDAAAESRIPINLNELKASLVGFTHHDDKPLRLKAMELLAYFDTEEDMDRIESAVSAGDHTSLSAAIRAICNTLDPRYAGTILELMSHPDDEISRDAIAAAGELCLRRALPAIYAKIQHHLSVPREHLLACITALGAIGDNGAMETLSLLGTLYDGDESGGNDDIMNTIDDAMDDLDMTESLAGVLFDGWDEEYGDDWEQDESDEEEEDAFLSEAIDLARDRCQAALEDQLPRDFDTSADDEECDCDHDHCDCGHEHHHHHHEEEIDLSALRLIDDLQAYEEHPDDGE